MLVMIDEVNTQPLNVSIRDELATVLADYRESQQDLADYEKQCRLAEEDVETLLADHSLPEEEAVERTAKAQARKLVHEARIAKREQELDKVMKRLESIVPMAEGELRREAAKLIDERREVVTARVLEVLRMSDAPKALWNVLSVCPAIQAVEACLPMNSSFIHVSAVERAADVLARFEKLNSEKGLTI